MRGGFTPELERRLRAVPCGARVMVHAEVVQAEDVIDTRDDWSTRPDSITGLEVLIDGGIRIFGSGETYIDHGGDAGTDATDDVIEIGPEGGPINVVEIEWGGSGLDAVEVSSLIARLDPSIGGGSNVETWHARLFRIHQEAHDNWDVLLQPISGVAEVAAAGTGPQDVTFDFATVSGGPVRIGAPVIGGLGHPVTVVMIWATTDGGAPATDAGWMAEPDDEVTIGAHSLRGYVYTAPNDAQGEPAGSVWLRSSVPLTGRLELIGRAYTEQVVEFTTPPLDLGVVPTGTVEFTAQGELPGDSAITWEVDDGGGYVEFHDGDTADSLGIATQQTYDVRVTLTPSSDGNTTPVARRLGVRELATTDLSDVATVKSVAWAVDPPTLRGEIPEAVITAIRDGEADYRSAIEELLSEHYTGQIEIRLYIGHPDLERRYWLHLDTFLIDDHEDVGAAVAMTCVSPLQYLGATIPPYDPGPPAKREPVEYANASLMDVWDDLLDGQIAVPGRYIGQGVTDDATLVTKTIEEARGKDELDAIAYLAGGGAISSQGRVKWVDMSIRGGPVAVFPKEEIKFLSVSPGLRNRVEEFFVPYDWSPRNENYGGETRAFDANAITKLARSYVEPPDMLDDRISRWIPSDGVDGSGNPTSTLADTIGLRQITRLGTGLNLWAFRSEYPHPELEPGDVVAVETDRFLTADPTTPTLRVLKGPLWGLGVVQRGGDVWGRDLVVWMDLVRIQPDSVSLFRQAYARPEITAIDLFLDASENVDGVANTKAAGLVRWASSTSAYPVRATVEASGTQAATDANGVAEMANIASLAGAAAGTILYVSALAYERADGTGSVSEDLFRAKFDTAAVKVRPVIAAASTQNATTGKLDLSIYDRSRCVTAVEFQIKAGAGDWSGAWVSTWDRTGGTIGTDLALTRGEDLARVAKHSVGIKYRVTYTDLSGASKTMEDAVEYDPLRIAEVTAPEVSFSAGGLTRVAAGGDEDTVAIYVTVGAGSSPSNPTAGTNDGVIAARSGSVTTAIQIDQAQVAYVKVVGENSVGDLGPVVEAQVVRPADRAPIWKEDAARDADTLTLILTLVDRHLALTAVECRERVGDGAYTAWTASTVGGGEWDRGSGTVTSSVTIVREEDVDVEEGKDSEIQWRATYTDEDGASRTIQGSVSSSNWDVAARTIQISLTGFVASVANPTAKLNDNSTYFIPSTTVVALVFSQLLYLPPGITITRIEAYGYRATDDGVTDFLSFTLWRRTDETTATKLTTDADTEHTTTGWAVFGDDISELVQELPYNIILLIGGSGAATDVRLFSMHLEYTRPTGQDSI